MVYTIYVEKNGFRAVKSFTWKDSSTAVLIRVPGAYELGILSPKYRYGLATINTAVAV